MDIRDPRAASPDWDLVPQQRDYAWLVAHRMVFMENDAESLFFYAKLPLLALSALLGIFVYRWAKDLYGVQAGLGAAFVYFLDPNILGHSPIVHIDVPFSAFFFIGTYFFCRALGQLTWANMILTSTFFGLAAVTKFSFWAVLPVWMGLGLVKILSSESTRCALGASREVHRRWGKAGLITATIFVPLVSAYFFIWGAYGFRFNAVAASDGHSILVYKLG